MINYESPLYVDIVLYTIYALLATTVLLTAWSAVRARGLHRGDGGTENGIPAARIVWLTGGVLVLTLALTWLTASTQPLNINGKTYSDAFWLRVSDMLINTALVLIIVVTLLVAVTGIATLWRDWKTDRDDV